MEKSPCIYIMTNKPDGTLYVGVTSDLIGRIYQHQAGIIEGFTKRYNLKTLVYYEQILSIYEALQREKRLKKWPRSWKLELIENFNPKWEDLYPSICQ